MASLFDQAIAPMARADFLAYHWNKTFLHLDGPSGRFRELLSWEDLGRILEQTRLEPPRLRLARNGKILDPDLYLLPQGKARLNAGGLEACLRQGATLILDGVDDLVEPVRVLAESFEEVLRARVSVNLYAGWRRDRGFNRHWDDQDTMILQLQGRKQWEVHPPTRLQPLRDKLQPPAEPKGSPIWQGVLAEGGLLYMPRGWWHLAAPPACRRASPPGARCLGRRCRRALPQGMGCGPASAAALALAGGARGQPAAPGRRDAHPSGRCPVPGAVGRRLPRTALLRREWPALAVRHRPGAGPVSAVRRGGCDAS
jgi:hypothetical protein